MKICGQVVENRAQPHIFINSQNMSLKIIENIGSELLDIVLIRIHS